LALAKKYKMTFTKESEFEEALILALPLSKGWEQINYKTQPKPIY
jgi:hypothetical protein